MPAASALTRIVAVIAGVELDFAADRWHAKGIAVAADTGDDAGDQMAGFRMIGRTEAQRVHCRNRACTHGEDIAQDAADTGGCALIRFDIGRMVVALHLEDDAIAIIDIDDTGIFARSLNDARTRGRQRTQPLLRGLVGAVLVPHGRKDAKLRERRLAAD